MTHTSKEKKSAIVTGASRGIGRSVATRLARDGFAVAVNYAGNATKAEEVVAEIKAAASGQAIGSGRCGERSRRGASLQGSSRHLRWRKCSSELRRYHASFTYRCR